MWFFRRRKTKGAPRAATSVHVWWEDLAAEPLVEVAATLTVERAPTGGKLSFWALQVTFDGPSGAVGGAHTGLQYNPRHTDARAVNWGGYVEPTSSLRTLTGSRSALAGFGDDENTRDYPWIEGRPYRFRIHRGTAGWASTVTDQATGEAVTIRELAVDADRLSSPVVWGELFGDCDDPHSSAVWSDFEAVTASGRPVRPGRANVHLPDLGTGYCDNVEIEVAGGSFRIVTGVRRHSPSWHRVQLST